MSLLPPSVFDLLHQCDPNIFVIEDFQAGYCQCVLRSGPNKYPLVDNQENIVLPSHSNTQQESILGQQPQLIGTCLDEEMVYWSSRAKQKKSPINQYFQLPTDGCYKHSECTNGENSRSEKIETLREYQWQAPFESTAIRSYIEVSGLNSEALPINSSDTGNPSMLMHLKRNEDNGFHPHLMVGDSQVLPNSLPEKGKFLEAVVKAGPLLQTLLLAGPLPLWQKPPPPLDSFEIPLVPLSLNPSMINSPSIPLKLSEFQNNQSIVTSQVSSPCPPLVSSIPMDSCLEKRFMLGNDVLDNFRHLPSIQNCDTAMAFPTVKRH